eukprot:10885177-Alexandrium_andersonii.AAC.1
MARLRSRGSLDGLDLRRRGGRLRADGRAGPPVRWRAQARPRQAVGSWLGDSLIACNSPRASPVGGARRRNRLARGSIERQRIECTGGCLA